MVKILVFIIPLLLTGIFIFIAKNSKSGNSGSLLLQGFVVLLFIGVFSFQGVEIYRWTQYEPERVAVTKELEIYTIANKSPTEKDQFLLTVNTYLKDVDIYTMGKHMPSKHRRLEKKLEVIACLKQALADKTIDAAEISKIEKLISE
jgi:hypothetical protein